MAKPIRRTTHIWVILTCHREHEIPAVVPQMSFCTGNHWWCPKILAVFSGYDRSTWCTIITPPAYHHFGVGVVRFIWTIKQLGVLPLTPGQDSSPLQCPPPPPPSSINIKTHKIRKSILSITLVLKKKQPFKILQKNLLWNNYMDCLGCHFLLNFGAFEWLYLWQLDKHQIWGFWKTWCPFSWCVGLVLMNT